MLLSHSRRAERCANPRSRPARQCRQRTLVLEFLEDRCLLSGAPVAHGQDAVNLIDPIRGFGHKHRDHVAWSSTPGAPATVGVFIHDHSGNMTAEQAARVRDAIAELGRTWDGSQGLQMVEVATNAEAKIHVHNDSTSGCGGKSQGVLGCAEYSYFISGSGKFADGHFYHRFANRAEVTLIQGWNWYAGASLPVPPGQHDYQTVTTQELAHAVGLDHDSSSAHANADGTPLNGDGHSAMYPSLVAGHAHRLLSDHDLASLRHLYAFGSNPDSLGSSAAASPASGRSSGRPGGGSGDRDAHHRHDEPQPAPRLVPPAISSFDRLPAAPLDSGVEQAPRHNDSEDREPDRDQLRSEAANDAQLVDAAIERFPLTRAAAARTRDAEISGALDRVLPLADSLSLELVR